MPPAPATELLLLRHAPALDEGRLAGRRDVPARVDPAQAARLAARVGAVDRVVASPRLRCRQTAEALFGAAQVLAGLEEQDFGAWEGLPYADLPDLGPLGAADLAAHCPPGGESFADLCARAQPVLRGLSGRVAVVAHAGTVRAALALAVGVPGALSFRIDPLSLTRMTLLPGGACSVAEVNVRP